MVRIGATGRMQPESSEKQRGRDVVVVVIVDVRKNTVRTCDLRPNLVGPRRGHARKPQGRGGVETLLLFQDFRPRTTTT